MNTLFVLEYKVIGLTKAKKNLNIPCWEVNFSWTTVLIWGDHFFLTTTSIQCRWQLLLPLVATNYTSIYVNSGPFIQQYYSLLPSQLE